MPVRTYFVGTTLLVGLSLGACVSEELDQTSSASTVYDSTSGIGFVGKGDVQSAFGWNNARLQANASGVSFSYDAIDTFSAVCTFVTGEGTRGEKTHDVTLPRHAEISSDIHYHARSHKQIDGFILTGLGETTASGTAPAQGAACVASQDGIAHDGTWTSVTLTSSSGGLSVSYGGTSVLLQ
jgi:hypothetical protein